MSNAQIIKDHAAQIPKLFKAIEKDWVICDDNDEDDFMVLVNEDRDLHKNLKPPKTLINALEIEDYIKLDLEQSDEKGKPREFMDWFDGPKAIPFVYFYNLTSKGKLLLSKGTS